LYIGGLIIGVFMRVGYNAMLLGNYFSGVEVTISTLGENLSYGLANDLHIFLNEHIQEDFSFPNTTCHTVKLPCRCRTPRILWEHLVLPKKVKKLKCDILHCPGYIAPYNVSCPTVVTVHDIIALTRPELCKLSNHLYYRMMLGRSVKQASQIIVPSNFVKKGLVKLFDINPEKINVIPFAPAEVFEKVDDADLLKQVRETYNLPEKFILFLANHEPKKNVAGVIKAFAEFRKMVKGYKLVLAGRAAWGPKSRKLIYDLAIEKDIIHPGYIPIADLLALYSLADIFLFPSLDEGFGIPILEAMACGVPVVCSDRGALPETAAGAAVSVPPLDTKGIAEALANFATDSSKRKDFIKKGFKRVSELSWEKTTNATLDVYKKAAG
jgi:glycosyltransferase involved in cell wall biosynthesis